jgi:hypothetical protein
VQQPFPGPALAGIANASAANNLARTAATHDDAGVAKLMAHRWPCQIWTWCAYSGGAPRVPEHARHQVRLECQVAPRHRTIVERRAPRAGGPRPGWTSSPIARMRYATVDMSSTLLRPRQV